MKKLLLTGLLSMTLMGGVGLLQAAPDLEANTPVITAIKTSMQTRHAQLQSYYGSGAIGLTQDGYIAVKDASAVPLSQRGGLAGLVKDENSDRARLYKEIAAANGHPEWQGEIQSTFAGRWIDKAQAGWFYQKEGAWVKK
ncbi:Protein of unknown function (DUF1318) [Methylophilaceae bacterium 11]|jgi:hypothetical protein|uniref:YdbL family protein n=1 Tax=unclassified Methylotenera TaxID=2643294 RepID=UPI00037F1657|nr:MULTISPECIES: YdbL family protein [unclassified Methylotenera]EUJ10912.1 Protein of unknown function (DUF1318) [Methylophilaceae bacterium 11]